jgi:GxxExxY protein
MLKGNQLTSEIISSAIEVHKNLGPGLLESIYEECMAYELRKRGLAVKRQLELPVLYKRVKLEQRYRIDLLVNDEVVIELKSTDKMEPIHHAQLLTYLKLSNKRYGLLLNFNVSVMRQGIKRLLNG